jgi:hypothetical protein
MQTLFSILALLATAFAAPVEHHDQLDFVVAVPTFDGPASVFAPRRAVAVETCDVDICTKLAQQCVKSCQSLENGDWYVAKLLRASRVF